MSCTIFQYFVVTCELALIVTSVFLRVSHLVKMVYMLLGLIVFNLMFFIGIDESSRAYDKRNS